MFRRFDSTSSVFPWLKQSGVVRSKMLAGLKAAPPSPGARPLVLF